MANLGTGASCYEMPDSPEVRHVQCGNFLPPRSMRANGAELGCAVAAASFTLPTPRAGGYCFVVGAGELATAHFSATF